jgi:hypothetical protein
MFSFISSERLDDEYNKGIAIIITSPEQVALGLFKIYEFWCKCYHSENVHKISKTGTIVSCFKELRWHSGDA